MLLKIVARADVTKHLLDASQMKLPSVAIVGSAMLLPWIDAMYPKIENTTKPEKMLVTASQVAITKASLNHKHAFRKFSTQKQ